jgi:hypothetical protein
VPAASQWERVKKSANMQIQKDVLCPLQLDVQEHLVLKAKIAIKTDHG